MGGDGLRPCLRQPAAPGRPFGAILAPAALGTLVSTFQDPRERGKASAGLFLIVFGFSHAETAGWTAALTLGSLGLGVLLLAGFVLAERRASHPLLPLRVILDRTRGGAYVAVGLAGISIFGVFLFLTYYLQAVKGYSPLTTGLLFLPFVGCILVSSNVSSIVTLPRPSTPPRSASGARTRAWPRHWSTRCSRSADRSGRPR